jgi:hypothetical protein
MTAPGRSHGLQPPNLCCLNSATSVSALLFIFLPRQPNRRKETPRPFLIYDTHSLPSLLDILSSPLGEALLSVAFPARVAAHASARALSFAEYLTPPRIRRRCPSQTGYSGVSRLEVPWAAGPLVVTSSTNPTELSLGKVGSKFKVREKSPRRGCLPFLK